MVLNAPCMQFGGESSKEPQKNGEAAGIVRELVNSPILIMVTLVGAAVTITHTVDGIEKDLDKKQAVLAKETEKQLAVQAKETEKQLAVQAKEAEKQLAVQAKETEICELRAQNDLRRCLMDMGYGSEHASWREKMLEKKGMSRFESASRSGLHCHTTRLMPQSFTQDNNVNKGSQIHS